jgi:hypothetical protein
MKREYEVYNPEVDKEHLELWGGALPGTRMEQIQWAHDLANLTGKEVRINAYNAFPARPSEPMSWGDKLWYGFWIVFWGFVALVLLAGCLIGGYAYLTGNIAH